MTSSSAVRFLLILLLDLPNFSQTCSHFFCPLNENRNLEKRSVLTFPPDSLVQINVGISLADQLERNSAAVLLAFQQNIPLPNETLPFLSPSLVVAARKFPIYEHLRNVIASYGFSGSECLRKMVCQVAETPLLGGLIEDVVTFVLTPSMQRSIQFGEPMSSKEEKRYLEMLLDSEKLGKLGGNCSSAFPQCVRTPLDSISAFIRA